jgi:hypothetical protein
MKGSRDLKRYMAMKRHYRGKKNGVISSACLDDLHLFKLERCKKFRKAHRRPRDGYLA